MNHKKVTWREVSTLSKKLSKLVFKQIKNLDDYSVVGLSRGGLIPAVIISQTLNLRQVHSLGIQSYNNKTQADAELYQVPNFSNMKKVILVDDLADTGNSFLAALSMLEKKEVITATLYKKDCSTYVPTCYAENISSDFWLDFPWEPFKLE